jgi:nitroimidazol reductase NimA-like FMN-containing flavoprotein (pyridoxamine 5'-phosphate oxidase superfamily)
MKAKSDLTRVRRLPERGRYEPEDIYAVLDAATHCHIAHVVDGQPVCTPTLHWRIADHVYWHGSVASRMLCKSAGMRVCLTATLLDGWVLARSAFNHSANYRAVMCFGQPELIGDDERKTQLLQAFTEQRYPGRWPLLRPMTRKELRATTILTMPLDMASAKVRSGPPDDPPRDRSWPVWAGVIPIGQGAARAVIAEGVPGGVKPPRLSVAQRGRR